MCLKHNLLLLVTAVCAAAQPWNQWTELSKDMSGARRGSSIRYASKAGAFFLWGFLNDDPDALQENRLLRIPEYDMVFFDPADGRWQNHLPFEKQAEWSTKLPMGYHPGIYAGITTGSRRTIMRGDAESAEEVPRPALNIVADQVAYRSLDNSLLYFTGGLLEGSETILFFSLLCLLPSWFAPLSWLFGALCFVTALSRVVLARQVFRDPRG